MVAPVSIVFTIILVMFFFVRDQVAEGKAVVTSYVVDAIIRATPTCGVAVLQSKKDKL